MGMEEADVTTTTSMTIGMGMGVQPTVGVGLAIGFGAGEVQSTIGSDHARSTLQWMEQGEVVLQNEAVANTQTRIST